MDNLTHTLVGVLVGETVARTTRPSTGLDEPTRRNLFVTIMAIGSNVPDLDFIQSRITGSKLDYLLHHRGHTHTILGALVVATLLYLTAAAWCRWRKHTMNGIDRAQLAAIASIAPLLHIAMDATNSYGVHPFWPLDNRWYYGDAVFIVEPLFWAACAPLVFVVRTLLAQLLVSLALAAGIVLSFVTGLVPQPMAITLVAVTFAMLVIGKTTRPQVALPVSLLVCVAINATFAQSSAVAEHRARVVARESFPATALLDVVLTPMPLNPVCWQLLLVQADAERWYVRRAALSIAPTMIASADCPNRSNGNTSATYTTISTANTMSVTWRGEIEMQRAALEHWIQRDCQAAALMRFARAPWLIQRDSSWILGDARFDNERELGFAEIELDSGQECMAYVPPWVPPRAELLERRE